MTGFGSVGWVGVLGQGWDITTSVFDSPALDISAQDTIPWGIYVDPQGQYLFICGGSSNEVHRYNLATAFDTSPTSATFAQTSTLIAANGNPTGIFFKPDGTKLYVVDRTDDTVYEYDLSTPWDITGGSLSFNQAFILGFTLDALGITMSIDGVFMFVTSTLGAVTETIERYTLSTPWDVSTATGDQSFDVSSIDNIPVGIHLKRDGSTLYMAGSQQDDVVEFNMPTPYSLTGMTQNGTFSFISEDLLPSGIHMIDHNGLKFFMCGRTNQNVYQYDMDIETA